ncbi:hypothetical protein TWF225_009600 [Orbilia oligospora]|nr:hypothetical protein TWF225_009600 [Orbilia oligospora]KAF3249849.1 hypothetical protein TWF217_008756 [Orbilia oligospora]KAF3259337.1 hypothetical protein TWF128_004404 [Orbilia oligospora]KAF3292502.1 hypothetical protein TWF132_005554 [Orbilia oligospora]
MILYKAHIKPGPPWPYQPGSVASALEGSEFPRPAYLRSCVGYDPEDPKPVRLTGFNSVWSSTSWTRGARNSKLRRGRVQSLDFVTPTSYHALVTAPGVYT